MARTALRATLSLLAATVVAVPALTPAAAKPAPPPVLTGKAVTVTEDAGKAVVRVALARKATSPVTVAWKTQHGTAIPGDYRNARGTVTVPKGKKAASITVVVLDDGEYEGTETFALRLASKQARVKRPSIRITILDDEEKPADLVGTITAVRQTSSSVSTWSSTLTLDVHLVPEPGGDGWTDNGTGSWHLTSTGTTRYPDDLCTPGTRTDIDDTGTWSRGGSDVGYEDSALVRLSDYDPHRALATPYLDWTGVADGIVTRFTGDPCAPTRQDPTTWRFDLLPRGGTSPDGHPGVPAAAYTGSSASRRGISFAFDATWTFPSELPQHITVTGTLSPAS